MATRKVVVIGNTSSSGFFRKEVYIDASDVSQTTDEDVKISDADYVKLLSQKGYCELLEHLDEYILECNVNFSAFTYGEDYDLGDIVMVETAYGYNAYLIISEVIESDDTQSGYKLTPSFEVYNIEPIS